MKLWCLERNIGQIELLMEENDSRTRMLEITSIPSSYDFFLQMPGEVVEHDGGYAHFVITFTRYDSLQAVERTDRMGDQHSEAHQPLKTCGCSTCARARRDSRRGDRDGLLPGMFSHHCTAIRHAEGAGSWPRSLPRDADAKVSEKSGASQSNQSK